MLYDTDSGRASWAAVPVRVRRNVPLLAPTSIALSSDAITDTNGSGSTVGTGAGAGTGSGSTPTPGFCSLISVASSVACAAAPAAAATRLALTCTRSSRWGPDKPYGRLQGGLTFRLLTLTNWPLTLTERWEPSGTVL